MLPVLLTLAMYSVLSDQQSFTFVLGLCGAICAGPCFAFSAAIRIAAGADGGKHPLPGWHTLLLLLLALVGWVPVVGFFYGLATSPEASVLITT